MFVCSLPPLRLPPDKTVKLWKVNHRTPHTPTAVDDLQRERRKSEIFGGDDPSEASLSACLKLPTPVAGAPCVPSAAPRQVFEHAHAYHVNSLSLNSDGRTFLSGDDLRINWWDLEVSDKSFNVVDMKPKSVEELTEVLTTARFHPHHCHTMVFGTSKGYVNLADTRVSALCDGHGPGAASRLQSFAPDAFIGDSFYSELLSSISDLRYSADGRYLIARDFLSVKVWDTHMSNKPVKSIPVNSYLRPALTQLYDTGCMFDKFGMAVSPDGSRFLAGSYSNRLTVYNTFTGSKLKDVFLPGAAPFYNDSPYASGKERSQSMVDAETFMSMGLQATSDDVCGKDESMSVSTAR